MWGHGTGDVTQRTYKTFGQNLFVSFPGDVLIFFRVELLSRNDLEVCFKPLVIRTFCCLNYFVTILLKFLNLFYLIHSASAFNISQSVDAWDDEKKHYTYSTATCTAVCGHYTQVPLFFQFSQPNKASMSGSMGQVIENRMWSEKMCQHAELILQRCLLCCLPLPCCVSYDF